MDGAPARTRDADAEERKAAVNEPLGSLEEIKLILQGGNLVVLFYVLHRIFKLAEILVRRVELRKDPVPPEAPAKKPHHRTEKP